MSVKSGILSVFNRFCAVFFQLLNDSALDGMDEDELDQVIEPVHDMDSGVPRLNAGNSTTSSTYAAMRQSRELFAAKKGQLEKQVS